MKNVRCSCSIALEARHRRSAMRRQPALPLRDSKRRFPPPAPPSADPHRRPPPSVVPCGAWSPQAQATYNINICHMKSTSASALLAAAASDADVSPPPPPPLASRRRPPPPVVLVVFCLHLALPPAFNNELATAPGGTRLVLMLTILDPGQPLAG